MRNPWGVGGGKNVHVGSWIWGGAGRPGVGALAGSPARPPLWSTRSISQDPGRSSFQSAQVRTGMRCFSRVTGLGESTMLSAPGPISGPRTIHGRWTHSPQILMFSSGSYDGLLLFLIKGTTAGAKTTIPPISRQGGTVVG